MKMPSKKIKAVVLGLLISLIYLTASALASVGGLRAGTPNGPGRADAAGNAAEISSVDAAVYCSHGNSRYELGDRKEAIRDFSAAVTLDPGFAEAYYGRGLAYLSLGDSVRAVVDLSTAIALKPGFARAYYGRGRAYYAAGNRFQAARDFRKAAELNPGLARAD